VDGRRKNRGEGNKRRASPMSFWNFFLVRKGTSSGGVGGKEKAAIEVADCPPRPPKLFQMGYQPGPKISAQKASATRSPLSLLHPSGVLGTESRKNEMGEG